MFQLFLAFLLAFSSFAFGQEVSNINPRASWVILPTGDPIWEGVENQVPDVRCPQGTIPVVLGTPTVGPAHYGTDQEALDRARAVYAQNLEDNDPRWAYATGPGTLTDSPRVWCEPPPMGVTPIRGERGPAGPPGETGERGERGFSAPLKLELTVGGQLSRADASVATLGLRGGRDLAPWAEFHLGAEALWGPGMTLPGVQGGLGVGFGPSKLRLEVGGYASYLADDPGNALPGVMVSRESARLGASLGLHAFLPFRSDAGGAGVVAGAEVLPGLRWRDWYTTSGTTDGDYWVVAPVGLEVGLRF